MNTIAKIALEDPEVKQAYSDLVEALFRLNWAVQQYTKDPALDVGAEQA